MQIKWFKSAFNSQVEYLEDYFDLTEEILKNKLKTFDENIDEQVKDLKEDEKHEFYEFSSDDHWKYSELIPNLNRSSIFLLFYSFFEHKLYFLGENLSSHKKCNKSQQDISGKGIKRSKEYFKKVLGIDFPDNTKEWQRLNNYGKIRNVIAHNGGKVEKGSVVYKQLIAFSGSVKNFNINHIEEIELNQFFMPDFLRDVKELFNKIYQNI